MASRRTRPILPGASPSQGEAQHNTQGAVDVNACPAIGDAGDRELGCAINLLRAGSADGFLASLGVTVRL